ncbi:TPA: phage major capsid protein, P2 family [Escherichia coli]|nr:phage major capsid protein, P2 family [Escherichia coli]HBA9519634.1 phage major capsid protein, P2 family [Escherichia coli]HBA9548873.1 phage major capsid protein, P2 family [Escherichia coli]HBA9557012.1 phage major capsid protein, P2 family [Escherichia coli]
MQQETRQRFNAMRRDLAQLNGVSDISEKFTVTPRVQQTTEKKIQESSDFLKKINFYGRTEQMGNKVGIGVSGPIASTTDTTTRDRETFNPMDLDEHGYVCTQTNFDTHISYDMIDLWAGFPDFQVKFRQSILRQQALDRILIGWNGTHRAKTSDRKTSPLLQDVNIGWPEKVRQFAPQNHMSEVLSGSKKIKIGPTIKGNEGFRNIDAAVFDAVHSCLKPWYQTDTQLVAITGRDLMADKYFPIVNNTDKNTEVLAGDIIMSQKRIGNLPALQVPFFPSSAIMVCPLYLLSLYYQIGSRRRVVIDNPRRDRIEHFESSNEAYVVEDYDGVVLIENIELYGDDGEPLHSFSAHTDTAHSASGSVVTGDHH